MASILPSSLSHALGAAVPYLPYVYAGALTITAIAVIYLAYTHIYAADKPQPQEDHRAMGAATGATDLETISTQFNLLFEIPNLKSMLPQIAMSQMEAKFKGKLTEIESHQDAEALTEAFFQSAKALFSEKQLPQLFFPRLKSAFEDLWLHPHIQVNRLPILFGKLGAINLPILMEAGIKILKEALQGAASFEGAEPIAMRLEALGSNQDAHLTARAMKESAAFEPKTPLCQGVLKLHQTLRALVEGEALNVTILAIAAAEHGINPGQAIEEIKDNVGDEEKTTAIWAYTTPLDNPFERYFVNPQFKEILQEDLGALSLRIDNSYESGDALYDLRQRGEMDRMIQMTIWLDLLSRAAGAGPRKFSTTMAETTDHDLFNAVELLG